MRRSSGALLAVLAACAPDVRPLELPAVEGSAAIIAAVERLEPAEPPVILRVVAIDLGAAFADDASVLVPDSEDATPRARVTALYYAEALAALGFAAGALIEARPGERGRRLPAFDAAFVADLDGERAAEWAPITTLTPHLEGLRIAETP